MTNLLFPIALQITSYGLFSHSENSQLESATFFDE